MNKYDMTYAVGMMLDHFIEEAMEGSERMRDRIITKWTTVAASVCLCAMAAVYAWVVSGGSVFVRPEPYDTPDAQTDGETGRDTEFDEKTLRAFTSRKSIIDADIEIAAGAKEAAAKNWARMWVAAHYPAEEIANVYTDDKMFKFNDSHTYYENFDSGLLADYIADGGDGYVKEFEIMYANVSLKGKSTVPLAIYLVRVDDGADDKYVLTGIEERSYIGVADPDSKKFYDYIAADPRFRRELQPYPWEVELGDGISMYKIDTDAISEKLSMAEAKEGRLSYNYAYMVAPRYETYDGQHIQLAVNARCYTRSPSQPNNGDFYFFVDYDLTAGEIVSVSERMTFDEYWQTYRYVAGVMSADQRYEFLGPVSNGYRTELSVIDLLTGSVKTSYINGVACLPITVSPGQTVCDYEGVYVDGRCLILYKRGNMFVYDFGD